jgi:glycosyltransferase involved in cell wall biosynthesis
MQLSVVVPTLNGRRQLAACLDALAAVAPESEVVVVNGPSADGTTGMVRDREDVDVLVEVADRNLNVARNAGIEHATGERIALVGHSVTVESGWRAGLADGFAMNDRVRARAHVHAEGYPALDDAEQVGAVTGPTHRAGKESTPESRTIARRDVTYFDGTNVAFTRETVESLDGFDEYLQTGGARDFAHRLAAREYTVAWREGMAVQDGDKTGLTADRTTPIPQALSDGGRTERDWHWKYRALAYRLVKNYGLRPTTVRRMVSHATSDALSGLVGVIRGEGTPSSWFANGRDVCFGTIRGDAAGLLARWRDRGRRNPQGISSRSDRAVAVYDWR